MEQDKEWIEFFKLENNIDELNIHQRNVIQTSINNSTVYMYENFSSVVQNKKYDFISIDGPWGSEEISRIDIIEYIEDILDEEFIILLDDYNRFGEKAMIVSLEQKLRELGIKFVSTKYESIKDIYLIVSPKWKWLTTL